MSTEEPVDDVGPRESTEGRIDPTENGIDDDNWDFSNIGPNDPEEAHQNFLSKKDSRHREWLSKTLLESYIMFIFAVFFAICLFVVFFTEDGAESSDTISEFSSLVSQVFTALTSLVSGVIGFYFGARSEKYK